jgi:hypothetical protein
MLVPAGGIESFLCSAFVFGQAAEACLREVTESETFWAGLFCHFFLGLRNTREHYANSFTDARSLVVSRIGRSACEPVLPVDLGLTPGEEDVGWGVNRLLDEGRAEAASRAIRRPTEQSLIALGLSAAARRNPLYLDSRAEVEVLVRLSLYRPISHDGDAIKAVTDAVARRAARAYSRHLHLSAREIQAWMDSSNFVTTLMHQKRTLGRSVPRDVIRQVLQNLGWRTYHHLARRVEQAMRCIQDMMSEEFTPDESALFQQLHYRQSHFGGLPFYMLAERYWLLEPVIHDVFHNPSDREALAVMHRLLSFYEVMASQRRLTDRVVQQARSRPEGPALTNQDDGLFDVIPAPEEASQHEGENNPRKLPSHLVRRLLVVRESRCACGQTNWSDYKVMYEEGGTQARFELCCARCRGTRTVEASLTELRQLVSVA